MIHHRGIQTVKFRFWTTICKVFLITKNVVEKIQCYTIAPFVPVWKPFMRPRYNNSSTDDAVQFKILNDTSSRSFFFRRVFSPTMWAFFGIPYATRSHTITLGTTHETYPLGTGRSRCTALACLTSVPCTVCKTPRAGRASNIVWWTRPRSVNAVRSSWICKRETSGRT